MDCRIHLRWNHDNDSSHYYDDESIHDDDQGIHNDYQGSNYHHCSNDHYYKGNDNHDSNIELSCICCRYGLCKRSNSF